MTEIILHGAHCKSVKMNSTSQAIEEAQSEAIHNEPEGGEPEGLTGEALEAWRAIRNQSVAVAEEEEPEQ